MALVSYSFWWPKMRADIQKYVTTCAACWWAKDQVGKPEGLLLSLGMPENPRQTISLAFLMHLPTSWGFMSYLGGGGHSHQNGSFCTLSRFSNYSRNKCPVHPAYLPTTQSPLSFDFTQKFSYISNVWWATCRKLGVQVNLSLVYHPQSDGQTERTNPTMEQYLRCFTTYQ